MAGDITFGAVGAAFVAAIVSLIGLILGKEQKTSEFRREWINGLRDEIAQFVTNVTAISDQVKRSFSDDNEKLETLAPYYVSVNSASNSIRLRLNPDEPSSKEILDLMDEIEESSASDTTISCSNIACLEGRLITFAQKLLKSEWRRVKSGELAFRLAKYIATAALVMLAVILLVWSLRDSSQNVGYKGPLKQPLDHPRSLPIKPKLLPSSTATAADDSSVGTVDGRVNEK